ncbi:response regulator transcription factor [Flavobacterium sp. UMI-01]|uniref:response regulator transcription factor n=1 Tax=Flavobacterium sp. UMI-01 TaxID=1441053 RepID=UPI001C7DF26B|nr:response regulator transcription factor [Flavobacterium sp. UMI-01]GIZ09259.1 DNA-binding response regulator [Flavobacterium sp. UMI-01]
MQKEVLIVDDHLVVRTGVSIILEEKFKNFNISTTENYKGTLKLLEEKKMDLIILDINIPGSKNTEMIQEIKNIQPEVKILIFSVYNEETHACPYIIAGANGYLNKLSDKKKITTAVDLVLKTGNYLTNKILTDLIRTTANKETSDPLEKLSKREKEITALLIKGDGNIEIANKLNIQLTTVSTHKNKIFNKLRIKNIVELINLFNKPYGLNS